jgi:hypothetical protein
MFAAEKNPPPLRGSRGRLLDVLSRSVKLDPRGTTLFWKGSVLRMTWRYAWMQSPSLSAHVLSSVQSAMQFELSIQFMNGLGSTVLLSRTRDGLILIGNSSMFLHSKIEGELWGRFFILLKKGQYVYQGFPVKCERHPKHAALLKFAGMHIDRPIKAVNNHKDGSDRNQELEVPVKRI